MFEKNGGIVMRRWYKKIFEANQLAEKIIRTARIFFLCAAFAFAAYLPARAEDIHYPADGELRADPEIPGRMSLFPDSPSGNAVKVEDAQIGGVVYGGLHYTNARDADSSGNTATVINSEVGMGYGGRAVVETGNGNAKAEGNTVNVTGSTIAWGDAIGGYADSESGNGRASASGNTVNISGSRVEDGSVLGGESGLDSGAGDAASDRNVVNITDSYVNYSVSGGIVFTMGNASASGNIINVRNSTIGCGEYYDSAISAYVIPNLMGGGGAGFLGDATASGNTITIADSFINASVYGGSPTSLGGNSLARNNTVTLTGDTGIAYYLSGGRVQMGSPTDLFTGNTLNVWEPKEGGISVGRDLSNFQYYNFVIPSFAGDGDKLLSVAGNAWLNGSQGGQAGVGSEITGINIAGGGRAQRNGEKFILIDAGTLNSSGFTAPSLIAGRKGAALFYDFDIAVDAAGNNLTATVRGEPELNPQMKSVSEGRAAGIAAASLGADLAAENWANSYRGRDFYGGVYGFGAVSYSKSRYKTGSHVDSDGFSVMAGLARDFPVRNGALSAGAFMEAGWGEYDSYNSFITASDVHGSGNTNYYGGGISLRMDYGGGEKGHFYNDAALRFGRLENDFHSEDLQDFAGISASYDYSSNYYGAHVGLGYIKNLKNDAKLDMYTRLLWTRVEGERVALSTGDPIDFADADSLRWRTGLRYSMSTNNAVNFYIGAAYEYEFDGDAKASVYGMPIASPSLEGGTGIGEIGFAYKKSPDSPFSLDLGFAGYTGQREGFGARLALNWSL
jgi:hypothetical protein